MLRHPLDALVNDPSGRPALCGATEFDALLQEMARESAPRLFAVMQEYGDRVDAQIAAWGLAFEDRADVISDNKHGALWTVGAG